MGDGQVTFYRPHPSARLWALGFRLWAFRPSGQWINEAALCDASKAWSLKPIAQRREYTAFFRKSRDLRENSVSSVVELLGHYRARPAGI